MPQDELSTNKTDLTKLTPKPADEQELLANEPLVIENSWKLLRQFTPARIGLGRAGHSLPTRAHLDFQLAHAQARDAVQLSFDAASVIQQLKALNLEAIEVHSAASNRNIFLRYPDLGRKLDQTSRQRLADYVAAKSLLSTPAYNYDIAFVLGDGLAAEAIHRHSVKVLQLLLAELALDGKKWRIAPIVVANQSRVALGDEIGYLLRAEQVAIFIGERPGLTSPDSLGIYLTYGPRVGKLESERNCISNIRPEGLQYNEATSVLLHLMHEARQRKLSGVELKDERDLQ